MIVLLNSVLRNKADETRVRVVWIEEQHNTAYIVKLNSDTAMPIYTELSYLCESGDYEVVSDPYQRCILEEDIPEKYKMQRNHDWAIIDELWHTHHKDIVQRNRRDKVIKEYANTNGVSAKKIKRLLSKYLMRGLNRNALLTDYLNSGGEGKIRAAGNHKRGRPREIPLSGEISIGINIDEKIRNIFSKVIKKHYNTRRKASLKHAYEMMLEEYFKNANGVVLSVNETPTYSQFCYWFKKTFDEKEVYISRNGTIAHQLTLRELLSDSNAETFGPGYRYQIDATIADVYLLSSINRERIIGRPVVYAIIDVFSRLVVGIYVGLEGPSWLGAMMALDNVLEDKVVFCKRHGVQVTEEEWPNALLPEIILADRGEFEGYNVENIINILNITIENTAPYRGDLKGIVERKFRTINGTIKHMLPGAIMKEYRQRGDRDYRLDATYTLEDFTAFILEFTIDHNNRIINGYNSDLGLIAEDIPSVPVQIWNWGAKNRACISRSYDREFVRKNFLPKGKARLTRRGIKFNNLFYAAKWTPKSAKYLSDIKNSLDIVYDPWNVDYIYAVSKNGRNANFEECSLTEFSMKFQGYRHEEKRFCDELARDTNKKFDDSSIQSRLQRKSNILEITKRAKSILPPNNKSKAERIGNIKENRREDKEHRRGNGMFHEGSREIKGDAIGDNQGSGHKHSKVDDLKKMREILHGK